MDIDDAKRESLASIFPAKHPLTCGTQRYPVNYSRISLSLKNQKYRKRIREKCEVGDDAFNSMLLYELPYIKDVLKITLAKFITFDANECG